MNLTIRIRMPKDRSKLAMIEAVGPDGEILEGFDPPQSCLCLSDQEMATKHGNPSRDPLRPFGDACPGFYWVTVIPPAQNTHSYGSLRRLLLTPLSGPCVQAEANGRTGEEIHEGDENPYYTQWNFLRPTYGCVRVRQATLKGLLALIDKYSPGQVSADLTEAA
ncbi:MAG TPA: hypothetical protein VKY31_15980 [Terriglobia bacterium]|nr:hypothetical protein [Terriglobia bacterium]